MNLELNEHELSFIDSFVIPDRRDRYRSKLRSQKKRGEFLDRLNHRFLSDIRSHLVLESPTCEIFKLQTQCYVIASEGHLDRITVSTTDAVDLLSDALFGILVSFIPGKLIAYKDEAPTNLVWLCKD